MVCIVGVDVVVGFVVESLVVGLVVGLFVDVLVVVDFVFEQASLNSYCVAHSPLHPLVQVVNTVFVGKVVGQ